MSYLGEVLPLQEASRLTGINLPPTAWEVNDPEGEVYLHLIHLNSTVDPQSVGGAIAAFLPNLLAVIEGNQPDGSVWVATFQYADSDQVNRRSAQVSAQAIRRALQLIGVETAKVLQKKLTSEQLEQAYEGVRFDQLADWGLGHKLVGLVVELANVHLDLIVQGVGFDDFDWDRMHDDGYTQDRADHRIDQFTRLLDLYFT